MSRKSRLETVARLKRIREDQAKAAAAKTAAEERDAAGEVVNRKEKAARPSMPTVPLPPTMLRALALVGVREQELVRLAQAEHEKSVERHRQSIRALARATSDKRSVEKLVQRRSADAAAARRHAADRALDELVIMQRQREANA